MMRRGRPGLAGTMARTAVIAGTATAVSGRVQQKQQAQATAAMQQAGPAPEPAAAPMAAPADAPVASDLMAQLVQLAELHTSGVLSDADFATAAKAKILG